MEKDIWLLAISLILTLDTAVWGPINDIFRTKFVTIKELDGEKKAMLATTSLLFYMFVFSSILVLLLIVFTDFFASLISSGYDFEQRKRLVEMIRLVAPILLFNQASLIGVSILNAYGSFIIPEVAGFFSQIFNILILVFFVDQLGIYVLWLGTLAGLLFLISLIIYKIKNIRINLFGSVSLDFQYFKSFFLFALPLFLTYFLGQFNGLIEKRLISSSGHGAVSIIDFSRKFPDMVNVIISSVILTVLTPAITKSFVNKENKQFDKSFLDSFGLGLLIIGFFTVFMLVASYDVIMFFYSKSTIAPESLLRITKLNKFYSLTAFAIFLYVIFGTCLLAIGRNKMNALAGASTQIAVICINVGLVNTFGMDIFPVSILIAHFLAAVFMFSYYPYDKRLILSFFIRIVIFLASVLIALSLIFPYIMQILSIEAYFGRVVVTAVLEVTLFIILGFVFNINEIVSGINLLLKRFSFK
ncbi:hypothetical protein BWD42_24305 [Sphingobacterium sp. CZ-UAM]|nr:hypothetical protein BWD42_24305 [Sphingobacterium sp. CZ-UAM]